MDKLIYFITFFIYQGYYAGLAIIISLGLTSLSRFYSIPLRILTLIAMTYVISKNYRRLFSKRNKGVMFIVVIFWILYFLKIIYHVNMGYSLFRPSGLEYMFYAIAFCVFPFFTYASIDFSKYKMTILNSMIFSGFVFGLVCLYLYKDVLSMGVGRISNLKYIDQNASDTLNPLALSYGGVLTLVLCLYKLIYIPLKGWSEKIYIYITIGLSLVLFFLGASRGSMIALVLSAGLFLYFGSFKVRTRALLAIIVSLPILIYGAVLSGSNIFSRLEETVESGNVGRGELWEDAWNEFALHPFLGNRIEVGFYPHNMFLETLMSTGIVGFVLLIIILFKGYKKIWFKSKKDVAYLIPFIIANQAISQHIVTGALYFSILVFFSMGLAFGEGD
ncbi:O-antigen ligase family protein [Sphingobacterium siyangense]|nr:O-antigen ligase family protein [Sphingobacterium siyangense]